MQVEKQDFELYIDVHIDFDKDKNFLVLLPNYKDHKLEHLHTLVEELGFHIYQLVFHEYQQVFQINRLKPYAVLQIIPSKTKSKQNRRKAS